MTNALASVVPHTCHAKALSLAEQAAPTDPAPPLVILESCDACDGLGVIDFALPHQHPIERTCSTCEGTGRAPIELFEADDREGGLVHVWSSERSYHRDEPAVCGADPHEDVVSHELGAYPTHCSDCLAVKMAVGS